MRLAVDVAEQYVIAQRGNLTGSPASLALCLRCCFQCATRVRRGLVLSAWRWSVDEVLGLHKTAVKTSCLVPDWNQLVPICLAGSSLETFPSNPQILQFALSDGLQLLPDLPKSDQRDVPSQFRLCDEHIVHVLTNEKS